jgi:SAM-dependent methyltransferase
VTGTDHFSAIAASYAAFRPRYSRELFELIASLAPARHRAWDCGAGSGQATADIAERFDEVVGTDVSEKQIARAPKLSNVRWVVASAEQVPIAGASIDLVTVAQALHWFDHERFYAEVRRVCVPDAVIAAWTYAAPRMQGDVGRVLERFMFDDIGAYWPPERKYVDDKYSSIPFPFARIETPGLSLTTTWTLEHVIGYLRSMSATARCIAATGVDPVIEVSVELAKAWPAERQSLEIEWPLVLLAGRV